MDKGADSYRRFLDGDESGLAEIIRDYKDGLILYINSFVSNIHTAEELAEDTFVKLFVKRPRDKGGSAFRTWLYTIGRNTALDYMRKRSSKPAVPLDELPEYANGEEELEAAYIKEERRMTVHRAAEKLRPEHRQVIWLVYFEYFSVKEAARIMHKSTHAAETLVYRARLALKEELEKEGITTYEDL